MMKRARLVSSEGIGAMKGKQTLSSLGRQKRLNSKGKVGFREALRSPAD